MNAARLAEIEALANAATPGPWFVAGACVGMGKEPDGMGYYEVATGFRIAYDACDSFTEEPLPFIEEDAAFIAEARTAVPDLVTALREARELAEIWHATALRFGRLLGPMALGPAAHADLESTSAAFDAVKEAW